MNLTQRGAVVIVRNSRVALIKRVNDRGVYYLFPGGGVEDGESPEDAAVREAREELGVDVRITGLLAVVAFRGKEQYYYVAEVIGGVFGTGTGEELSSSLDSDQGTYSPVWVALDALRQNDVRPRPLADLIETGVPAIPPAPLMITEHN